MDRKKIKKLESKVKRMYFHPPDENINETRGQFLRDFWDHHVVPVIKESRRLAKKYKADEDIVWLGAILHDVSLVEDMENHDEKSAQIAYKMLLAEKFDKETAEKVKKIALTHRCRKYCPQALEEKIVATADAMNHFLPSFYLGIAMTASEEHSDMMKKNIIKLERDFEQKIFFPAEKKMIKKRLADIKRWFEV